MRRTYTIDWAGHNRVSAQSKREFFDKHIIPSDPKYCNWQQVKSIIKGKRFLAVLLQDIKCDRDQKAP